MCNCCGGNTQKVTFSVKGMSCNHCVGRIEKGLKELKGIKDMSISLESGTVNVEYNLNDINENIIKNAIIDTGYEVL